MWWDCSSALKAFCSPSWGSESNRAKCCSQYLSACHQSKAVVTYSYMCLEVSIVTGAKPAERHTQCEEEKASPSPLQCHIHFRGRLLQQSQAFTHTARCTWEKLKVGHFGRFIGHRVTEPILDICECAHKLNHWPKAGAAHLCATCKIMASSVQRKSSLRYTQRLPSGW